MERIRGPAIRKGVKGIKALAESISHTGVVLSAAVGLSGLGGILIRLGGNARIVKLNKRQLVECGTDTLHHGQGRCQEAVKPALHIGNDIVESSAYIGAHGSQSAPDTQSHIGHHKSGIFHRLDGHIDAAGDNTKETGGHTRGLCNPVAEGNNTGHQCDDTQHNPSDRASQQGGIEANLCARCRGCSRRICKRCAGFQSSGCGIDGIQTCLYCLNRVDGQHYAVVRQQSCDHATDDGAQPAPVVNHKGANSNYKVKAATQHGGQSAKCRDSSVGKGVEIITICQLVYFVENGVKNGEGLVLHIGPHLCPGHGHTLKLGIGFIRNGEKGIFDHLSGDKALLCVFLDGALCHAHVALNGSGNTGCIFKDGV